MARRRTSGDFSNQDDPSRYTDSDPFEIDPPASSPSGPDFDPGQTVPSNPFQTIGDPNQGPGDTNRIQPIGDDLNYIQPIGSFASGRDFDPIQTQPSVPQYPIGRDFDPVQLPYGHPATRLGSTDPFELDPYPSPTGNPDQRPFLITPSSRDPFEADAEASGLARLERLLLGVIR